MTTTAEKKTEIPNPAHEKVRTVTQKAMQVIFTESADMEPKARWLFIGQVASSIFQQHFLVSILAAGAEVKKASNDIKSVPPVNEHAGTPPPETL